MRRCLLVEGCKNVEVLGVLRRNSTEVELHFSLCKPDLWLGSPEGWQLERDCVFYCHELTFLGFGVTTVVTGINSLFNTDDNN